ncbi:hypothetical protein HDU67_008626, partial [Dinochytrium kinnereticum]
MVKRTSSVDEEANKRARPDQGDLSRDLESLHALFNWAGANGASVDNFEIFERDDEVPPRGGVAVKDIPAGGLIGYLPEELILSESVAKDSKVGGSVYGYMAANTDEVLKLLGDSDPYAPGLLVLASFIAYERFYVRQDSFWWPYLQILPENYDLPVEWSDEEVNTLLAGTNLFFIVRERRKLLQNAVGIIKNAFMEASIENEIRYEHLLWAYCAIASRAFPKPLGVMKPESAEVESDAFTSNRVAELCLYPVLDMLNHQRGKKIEWNSIMKPGISFITVEAIKSGETVWNNYGPKGNENLLANYGFVLDNNPEDYFKLSLNIRMEDPLREQRLQALKSMPDSPGLVHLLFLDDTRPPDNFLAAARAMVCRGDELDELSKGKRTLRCELATLSTLWGLLNQKLKSASVSTQNNLTKTHRTHLANVYCAGQTQVLKRHIQLVENEVHEVVAKQFTAGSGSDEDPLDLAILTTFNPLQDSSFLTMLSEVMEEIGGLDEETILSLVLINEMHLGPKSAWARFFSELKAERLHKVDLDLDEINAQFDEELGPLFEKYPSAFPSAVFTRQSYLKASQI